MCVFFFYVKMPLLWASGFCLPLFTRVGWRHIVKGANASKHVLPNSCHQRRRKHEHLTSTTPASVDLAGRHKKQHVAPREHPVSSTRTQPPFFPSPNDITSHTKHHHRTRTQDLWSIGVISYILLCGYPPFYGKTDKEIFISVRRGEYDFPGPEWDTVSDEAKEFVKRLLMLDPNERPTASEVSSLRFVVGPVGAFLEREGERRWGTLWLELFLRQRVAVPRVGLPLSVSFWFDHGLLFIVSPFLNEKT